MRNFFLSIIFLASALTGFSQTLDHVDNPVFGAGEQLSYKLKYGIFTAAEANLRVQESATKFGGKPALQIVAEGKTAGTFDVFYKVRNRYDSYIDKSTLLPYFYSENRREGSWKHTDKVTFNQAEGKLKAEKGEFTFEGKVFDFVSAYYYARSLDISNVKVGETITMPYFLEDGIHNLTVTYLGKEKVKCSMGTFNCLKFNPTIIPGKIFKKNSKLMLWVTDDGNRIPVKAHVEVIVGSLTMDLTGAKGLKHPLNPVKK
ncbi:DUF3108 domain-containing protein [Mucilaginibacter limnophilus]|uniref:DUF3108 domain-containing protein n=1 Tax=Mucilaginibacter limnophilus TaxID=1932778 RepID=A0A437MW73_9SPHI|nr:DUF3108 domain-containing protein [Mucilaginibacter limnophilus]RVU01877.1 DUF3108 domain-containing protein [Mucilaginibacter limnophilus]